MASEFLQVAERLLESQRCPMTPRELWEEGKRQGMFSDKIAGRTPHQTMKSKLSVHVRDRGGDSIFVRTGPGQFYLRRLIDSEHPIYNAPPSRPPPPSEHVLSFPISLLDKLGRFQGLKKSWKRIASQILRTDHCSYRPRLDAENEDNHKQVLTYGMVVRRDQVLSFKRGTYNWTEEYLRGSLCIGFGGHVTEHDFNLFNREDLGVRANIARELNEELSLPRKDIQRLYNGEGLELIGVLNDDSSDVGRRHFGFVFQYTVSNDPRWERPLRGEKSITQLKWLNLNSRPFPLTKLEYWSQLCMRSYFKRTVRAQNSYIIRRKSPLIPPHVLCVLGPIGSGKTETSAVLTRNFGYHRVNSGKILSDLLGIPPVSKTPRKRFQALAHDFISNKNGPRKLAKTIWKAVSSIGTDRVLVDGIRHHRTLDEIRAIGKERRVGIVYVQTAADLAYNFYSNRGQNPIAITDFYGLREAPVEKEVTALISDADAVIYNWQDRPTYWDTVHQMMRDLGVTRNEGEV